MQKIQENTKKNKANKKNEPFVTNDSIIFTFYYISFNSKWN